MNNCLKDWLMFLSNLANIFIWAVGILTLIKWANK